MFVKPYTVVSNFTTRTLESSKSGTSHFHLLLPASKTVIGVCRLIDQKDHPEVCKAVTLCLGCYKEVDDHEIETDRILAEQTDTDMISKGCQDALSTTKSDQTNKYNEELRESARYLNE